MSRDEALQILVNHSQFFEIYAREKYVPRAMEGTMNEIKAAYQVINPAYNFTCQSCGNELIVDANRHRLAFLKEQEAKKHTFPKHEKKSRKILLLHFFDVLGQNQFRFGGVSYYRVMKPNHVLATKYPDFEFVTMHSDDDGLTDELIKEFDLVIFARRIKADMIIRLKKIGIPFGLDLDDYWHLPTEHLLYETYKQTGETETIINSIKAATFVTTTTPILAAKIKELNPNVHIIENGIDTSDEAWKPNKKESKRIRYGFTQGSTHIPDVELISDQVVRSLYDHKFYSKCQVVLTGFEAKYKEPSVYIGYERMLTDSLKVLDKYEKDYCRQLKSLHTPKECDKPYRRIESVDVVEFGKVYDEFDISVAPLKDSEFNACKSELKMIEAGVKGCAVMVSDVNPYKLIATKQNSFLLSEKNFREWSRYILMNPSIVQDKAAQLAEDVKKYDLELLTEKRKQVYEHYL